jgi:hypothetical protein
MRAYVRSAMKRTLRALPWGLAFALTLVLALFQRLTGPSYPARGKVSLAGADVSYRLRRSHPGAGGLDVRVDAPEDTRGTLLWRRYPTHWPWNKLQMSRREGMLSAEVPHQPPAGKVEYQVVLERSGARAVLPSDEPVIARFRGEVPAAVLVPHILAMFLSMLLASRALVEILRPAGGDGRFLVLASMALLLVGGLLLGPLVQHFAFGVFWSGWPVGPDLTDSKTLVAVAAWAPATVAALLRRRSRVAVVVGWLVMMGAFLIPHSLRGSQLDWSARAGSASSQTALR